MHDKLQHAPAFMQHLGRALFQCFTGYTAWDCSPSKAGVLCQADNTHSLLYSKTISFPHAQQMINKAGRSTGMWARLQARKALAHLKSAQGTTLGRDAQRLRLCLEQGRGCWP